MAKVTKKPVKKAVVRKITSQATAEKAESKESIVTLIDFTPEARLFLKSLFSAVITGAAGVVHAAAADNKTTEAENEPGNVKSTSAADVAGLLTEIRTTINAKVGENKTADVMKVLSKYGAQSASTLTEEKYASALHDLKAL
jgi:type VI protein secretion system component VasK